MDEETHWNQFTERLLQINALLEDLPAKTRVDFLSGIWLFAASAARSEALVEPGGFPAERTRQLERLENMTLLTAADEPDLEMERLGHEGDYEGLLRLYQERLKDANPNQDAASDDPRDA